MGIGFVGRRELRSSMLLPHLVKEPGIELARVATRRSLSAVNAQRKFQFRDAGTDSGGHSRRPSDRCGVHRHPAQHARRPDVPRARGRKGRVRREAAGADTRRARTNPRDGGRDRQRQGHGRLQSSILPTPRGDAGALRAVSRADERPLSRQRRTSRVGQLVSGQRTRRLSVRGRRWALRGHDELVDGQRSGRGHDDGWRRSRRSAGEPSLRRWVARDDHVSDQYAPALPQGDLRGLERGTDSSARQFQADHRLGGSARSGPSAPRAAGQGSSPPKSRPSWRPCAPVDRCRSPWSRWWRPPAPPLLPQHRPSQAAAPQQL